MVSLPLSSRDETKHAIRSFMALFCRHYLMMHVFSDTSRLYDGSSRQPREEKRFFWPFKDMLNSRPDRTTHRSDTFRFFHKGLGKRVSDTSLSNLGRHIELTEQPRPVNGMKSLVEHARKILHQSPYYEQYMMASNPDTYLENAETFRRLLGLNYLNSKRTPEEFSETLYPIQGGKQQLEATLDRTLNPEENHFVDNENELDEAMTNLADNAAVLEPDITNDVLSDNKMFQDTDSQSPYDLIFASPDLDSEYPYRGEVDKTHNTAPDTENPQVSKRWWAARMLNRFRSPKSWTRRIMPIKHIDPALYFIGLGK